VGEKYKSRVLKSLNGKSYKGRKLGVDYAENPEFQRKKSRKKR
jgi:RNA recognition motif-containing protein